MIAHGANERLTLVLSREHAILLARLDELDRARAARDLQALADVFRSLRDGLSLHRRKEEVVLFPSLAKRFGADSGPIACMLAEHELEVQRIAELEEALLTNRGEETLARADRLVTHLRNHIWKEDNVLFPMAESLLDAEERDGIRTALERIGACCPTCAVDQRQ